MPFVTGHHKNIINRLKRYILRADDGTATVVLDERIKDELKKFVKTAEGVLETNNKMVTDIEKLSPHTKLHISPVTRLRSSITATFAPLMDSINAAKHPIEGKRGRRHDTLRDNFLLEIVLLLYIPYADHEK